MYVLSSKKYSFNYPDTIEIQENRNNNQLSDQNFNSYSTSTFSHPMLSDNLIEIFLLLTL